MEVLRQVPRERDEVDRLIVDETMALRGDAKLVEQRGHIANVPAPRRPDVVIDDEDFLRGLHEGPRRLDLAREEGEVFRLEPDRRRAAGDRLEGAVHLDEPALLVRG